MMDAAIMHSEAASIDSSPSLDIRVIMGRWSTAGCRWVYFAERDGLVKIGYSANVDQRMRQLGARLLAVMPGGAGMEGRMHALFAEYHAHGEWFHPGLGLVSFIEALHGDDPYFTVGLPEDYSSAEVRRLIAEQVAGEEAERGWATAQAFTIGPEPINRDEDRRAAALIGAALSSAVREAVA